MAPSAELASAYQFLEPFDVLGRDAGEYEVMSTNAAGSVVSAAARVTVLVAPIVIRQPSDRTVAVGGVGYFTVTMGGSSPFGYQWYFNGTNPVSHATNAVLTLSGVAESADGNYHVVATNIVGSVTSQVARLTVWVPPRIIVSPGDLSIAQGTEASFSVLASGNPPPFFRWLRNGSAISGATNSTLTISGVAPSDSGAYSVQVFNAAGFVTSDSAALIVLDAPIITKHPTNQTAIAQASVQMFGQASGAEPLHFQWFQDGKVMIEETNMMLSIPSVTRNSSGLYHIVVSNTVGRALSDEAFLRVLVPSILEHPRHLSDGRVRIIFGANDQVALTGGDLNRLVIEGSRDFTSWSTLSSNGAGLTLTNGQVRFDDTAASSLNSRFYRVFER